MTDSVYTKIIKGELPCHKIYENEKVLVFMDIYPILPGHTLVIPKQQIEFVWDLPEELYTEVMAVSKKVALRLRQILPAKFVSERIVGVDVPHAHVQLIPFNNASDLAIQPDMDGEVDHDALERMAKKLAF